MPFKVAIEFQPGQFAAFTDGVRKDIATAATAAVTEAGNIALRDGKADIAAAGFSRKWQSALHLDIFPKGQIAIDPAAVIRLKIPYGGVFEDGAVIGGNPFLWLPIDKNLPTRSGGRRWTPSKYAAAIGPLVSIHRGGNQPPLLGGKRNGRVVPLFVGVGNVNVGKKFHIRDVIARAAAQLGSLFQQHLGSS